MAIGAAMSLMLVWFAVALILRWRFQFGIRSLLFMAVVVALPLSWLSMEMKDAREQRKAVEAIDKLGGVVWYDWLFDHKYRRHKAPAGPDWLRSLLGPDFLADVSVVTFNTQIGNRPAGLAGARTSELLMLRCRSSKGLHDSNGWTSATLG